MQSHIPLFADLITVHKISLETARILDDARCLTVLALRSSENDHSRQRIMKNIHTIHQRHPSSPPTSSPEDSPSQACRSTALVYSTSILTCTSLSLSCTPSLFHALWTSMWRIPFQRWKRIPGIFVWILLVASPYARDMSEGRFFKALMPATMMAMGVVDWDTVVGTLRSFLAVQRWLGGELRAREIGGARVRSRGRRRTWECQLGPCRRGLSVRFRMGCSCSMQLSSL